MLDGYPLADDTAKCDFSAHVILNAKGFPVAVSEIELGHVAVQVALGAVLVDAFHAAFDFRYSNRKALGIEDNMRAEIALRGIVGKRLTYETIGV